MTPQVHVTTDLPSIAGPLLARLIADCIAKTGRCRLGLSGGSTPGSTFAWLATHLPRGHYAKLWLTWVDERHLPVQGRPGWAAWHPDTNLHLARAWLDRAPFVYEQVLPMSWGGDLQGDLARFTERFARDFDGGLDLAQLGVGSDGHIASLFPGHTSLEAEGLAVSETNSPKAPPQRLSLTLPVLARSTVVLLARGADKAPGLARALAHDPSLPLGLLRCERDVHWVLDPPAAADLSLENP